MKYTTPEIEIVRFDAEEVIVASTSTVTPVEPETPEDGGWA